MPSRNARHGMLFTSEGIINIKNKKWEMDFTPIDPNSGASTDLNHSKAYLRHLIISKENLGIQIATIHNLAFYLWLVKTARVKIKSGEFTAWKNEMLPKLRRRL
jgi:queuine tRNA-ribosyltransferase